MITSQAIRQARVNMEKTMHGRDGFSHVKQTFARLLSSAVKSGVNVVKVSSEMGCIFLCLACILIETYNTTQLDLLLIFKDMATNVSTNELQRNSICNISHTSRVPGRDITDPVF